MTLPPGFIPWKFGESLQEPHPTTRVDVIFADNSIERDAKASFWNHGPQDNFWRNPKNPDNRIAAYRITPPEESMV